MLNYVKYLSLFLLLKNTLRGYFDDRGEVIIYEGESKETSLKSLR